jgi:hypothetical protein
MNALLTEVLGWLAAGLTLLTFACADMRRLRLLALGANAAFISYGWLAQLWPVLALHALLLPVNLLRLRQALAQARQRPRRRGWRHVKNKSISARKLTLLNDAKTRYKKAESDLMTRRITPLSADNELSIKGDIRSRSPAAHDH